MKFFIKSTVDPKYFQIENVDDDNACLYRALANGLNYRTKSNKFISCEDKVSNIDCSEVYGNEDWGSSGDKQDKLARQLQNEMRCWLNENKNIISNFGMTFKDLVETEHEINFIEYLELYKYFAGDEYTYMENTKYKYKSGPKKGQFKQKKQILDNRWGGTPEIMALSHIIKCPIIVYTSQGIRKGKIITGRIRNDKPEKNVRLKVYQIIGQEYLIKGRPSLFLIWKKTTRGPHYLSMYLKNPKTKIDFYGRPEQI